MQRTRYTLLVVPRAAGLALLIMLVVALFWTATAQAQTPADDQYGGPKAQAGSAQAGGGAGGGSAQAGGAQAGGAQAKVGGSSGMLPATGGPAFLAYAGALAASGAGLMLLRSGRGK